MLIGLGKAGYPTSIRLPFGFQSCMRCAPLLEVREKIEIGSWGRHLKIFGLMKADQNG